jgi:hypothetical protein
LAGCAIGHCWACIKVLAHNITWSLCAYCKMCQLLCVNSFVHTTDKS